MSDKASHRRAPLRIGCVSFLNAKPLIEGLDSTDHLDLRLAVPSRLLDGLAEHQYDAALLPVIDFQRRPGLRLLTAGGIGCDGPTLTVRIFSRVPVERIATLACDTDSHTSVALAKIVLAERYGARPRLIDLSALAADVVAAQDTALLLIGDKVVCEEPTGYPHQVDLGQAWKELTGLPFLFAAWMAVEEIDVEALCARLTIARRAGMQNIESIIARYAVPRGWPIDVARDYLTKSLQFEITARHLAAVERFHRLAHQHGVIPHEPWPLRVVGC